jgi:guanine deaminase
MGAERFMQRAIAVAREGMQNKAGGPFGAVVVKNGEIIGEGSNRVTSSNDPTAHAEIVAIRMACQSLGTFSLEGATLYTTCEPCPMCYAAIFWSRVDEVIYASDRKGAALAGFDDNMLWDDIATPVEARQLPMRKVSDTEANALFDAWRAMPDKTPY